MTYMLSLLAHSNQFHCMTYWLETSKVGGKSFGEGLFSEFEWMESLVSTGIEFCPSLLLVMPYSPSGMPKALFFRTLDLQVIFQKLLIWCLLMEFRLWGVQLLDYIQTNDPSDAKGKSLKCTCELNQQYCRKGRTYYVIKFNSLSFASLDALHWGKSKKLILNKHYFSSAYPGKG